MIQKEIVVKKKIYAVNWYCNGYCYRTTTECTWDDVKELRKVAKSLGETITYELLRVETYRY
jgi:hypothetical protein